jgi:preprotein translocase subunit SecD
MLLPVACGPRAIPGNYVVFEVPDPATTELAKRWLEHVTIIDGAVDYGFRIVAPNQIRFEMSGRPLDASNMELMADSMSIMPDVSFHMPTTGDASSYETGVEQDGFIALWDRSKPYNGDPVLPPAIVLIARPEVERGEIVHAKVGADSSGLPSVIVQLQPEAAKRFESAQGLSVPRRVAFVVDRAIVLETTATSDRDTLILATPEATDQEAQILADMIATAVLPEKLLVVETGHDPVP